MSIGTAIYERATRALIQALRDETAQIPQLMQALANENLEATSLPAGTISASDKLHTGKGTLQRALIKGKSGNVYKASLSFPVSEFEYGVDTDVIPYFNTHEFGDERPITPKMRRFFWAKFFETGHEMWRGLALTKRTTITYKARPILGPAFEEFEENELPSMTQRILARVAIAFNAD